MLKIVLLSLVLIIGKGALGASLPTPFLGEFKYTENLRPIVKIQVEAVPTFSPRGKQRLATLKSESYSCRHVMNSTYRCSRSQKLDQVETWAKVRIEKQMRSSQIRFSKPSGVKNLVDNDDYKTWLVDGEVQTALGAYTEYLLSWTPTLSKVTLKDESRPELELLYFNIEESGDLNQQFLVNKTLDKHRYESHVIQAVFENNVE
jgi:hypothetical protein